MADNVLKRTAMPEQDPEARSRNFEEVALGYTEEMAVSEASRCINCKNTPCIDGCPVSVRIPDFIEKIKQRDFDSAAEIIYETNSLPAVCGRVCPQESQCEGKCIRGIKGEPVAIGRLERFAADIALAKYHKKEQKQATASGVLKAAVIGSGPAGLSCAGELAKKGYAVTVFEALHTPGGVLVYGIPQFRLPKEIVAKEVSVLEDMGVQINTNTIIGRTIDIDELFEEGYSSVFIGTGAGLPNFMGIPGENLLGVYSANEYLTRVNLMKAYNDEYDTPLVRSRSVAVVGGGNVAMDAARCAKRLGAEVYVVYRRGEEELPARREEVHHAKEEGIIFRLLNNPVEITGDSEGHVTALKCVRMELGEPDASGRKRPAAVEGSEFMIDADAVIMAIGTSPNPLITKTTQDLDFDRYGCITADEATMQTSREGIFAGGDAVTGAATVIQAMGAGRKAAIAMDEYMKTLKNK